MGDECSERPEGGPAPIMDGGGYAAVEELMSEAPHLLSREEEALAEMRRTAIARPWAGMLTALFLALIFAVPLAQVADEGRQYARGQRPSARPQCADLFGCLPEAGVVLCRTEGRWERRVAAANAHLLAALRRYEDDLEDQSWLTRELQPPVQWVLTHWGGAGNERVYPGVDGWAFFQPDVHYVAGRGFFDPLPAGAAGRQTDSLRAILAFDRALRARGIRLVLMPVPVKPMIHPDALYPGLTAATAPLHNVSFPAWAERLRAAGVAVFDAATLLADYRRATGQPAYLAADTHWRPEAMEWVARHLADRLRASGVLPDAPPLAYRREPVRVAAMGDTAAMLKLPSAQNAFALETAVIRQVFAPDGQPWRRTPRAAVLLLGDSFANIYSLPSMGWGTGAGLAEQLSYYLACPLDRIVRNDNGAFAGRLELVQRQAAGEDPLAGVRVVIWEFTMRELTAGDWKMVADPEAR